MLSVHKIVIALIAKVIITALGNALREERIVIAPLILVI